MSDTVMPEADGTVAGLPASVVATLTDEPPRLPVPEVVGKPIKGRLLPPIDAPPIVLDDPEDVDDTDMTEEDFDALLANAEPVEVSVDKPGDTGVLNPDRMNSISQPGFGEDLPREVWDSAIGRPEKPIPPTGW